MNNSSRKRFRQRSPNRNEDFRFLCLWSNEQVQETNWAKEKGLLQLQPSGPYTAFQNGCQELTMTPDFAERPCPMWPCRSLTCRCTNFSTTAWKAEESNTRASRASSAGREATPRRSGESGTWRSGLSRGIFGAKTCVIEKNSAFAGRCRHPSHFDWFNVCSQEGTVQNV